MTLSLSDDVGRTSSRSAKPEPPRNMGTAQRLETSATTLAFDASDPRLLDMETLRKAMGQRPSAQDPQLFLHKAATNRGFPQRVSKQRKPTAKRRQQEAQSALKRSSSKLESWMREPAREPPWFASDVNPDLPISDSDYGLPLKPQGNFPSQYEQDVHGLAGREGETRDASQQELARLSNRDFFDLLGQSVNQSPVSTQHNARRRPYPLTMASASATRPKNVVEVFDHFESQQNSPLLAGSQPDFSSLGSTITATGMHRPTTHAADTRSTQRVFTPDPYAGPQPNSLANAESVMGSRPPTAYVGAESRRPVSREMRSRTRNTGDERGVRIIRPRPPLDMPSVPYHTVRRDTLEVPPVPSVPYHTVRRRDTHEIPPTAYKPNRRRDTFEVPPVIDRYGWRSKVSEVLSPNMPAPSPGQEKPKESGFKYTLSQDDTIDDTERRRNFFVALQRTSAAVFVLPKDWKG